MRILIFGAGVIGSLYGALLAEAGYDVSVYDMGTEHPTLATPTPETPVVTYSELPFRRTKAVLGGISCISVSGHKAAQSMYDQSLEPMIDNLRVSHTLPGLVLIVQ